MAWKKLDTFENIPAAFCPKAAVAAVAGPKLEEIDETGDAVAELARDAGCCCIDVRRDEDLYDNGGEMASLESLSGVASGSGMDRAGGS